MRVPSTYANVNPGIQTSGLTPLQIALVNTMTAAPVNASNSPILINKAFINTMNAYADSGVLSPTPYDSRTSTLVDINSLPGYSYVTEGDAVYLYRRAEDCGEQENRVEKILIGNLAVLSQQLGKILYTYYGSLIRGGSVSSGAGGPYGTGGLLSPYPGSDGSTYNTDTTMSTFDDFQGNAAASTAPAPRGGIA
jgi:hypothetical protein